MRKTLVCLLLLASVFQVANAQDRERAVMKGQNSINVYYGVNLLRGFYKSVADETALNVKIGGIGPVGLVYEHMVTDGIGLGVELGYGQTTVSYDYESWDWNNSNITTTYTAKYKFSNIRAQVRANFHFTHSSNFDAYFLLSAGYRGNSWSVESTEPNFVGGSISGFVPFGIKPGLGLRYFFTDNIGLHLEIAAGTPVMGGGLSLRF